MMDDVVVGVGVNISGSWDGCNVAGSFFVLGYLSNLNYSRATN